MKKITKTTATRVTILQRVQTQFKKSPLKMQKTKMTTVKMLMTTDPFVNCFSTTNALLELKEKTAH